MFALSFKGSERRARIGRRTHSLADASERFDRWCRFAFSETRVPRFDSESQILRSYLRVLAANYSLLYKATLPALTRRFRAYRTNGIDHQISFEPIRTFGTLGFSYQTCRAFLSNSLAIRKPSVVVLQPTQHAPRSAQRAARSAIKFLVGFSYVATRKGCAINRGDANRRAGEKTQ